MRLELRIPHAPMLSNLRLETLHPSGVCRVGASWDDEELRTVRLHHAKVTKRDLPDLHTISALTFVAHELNSFAHIWGLATPPSASNF